MLLKSYLSVLEGLHKNGVHSLRILIAWADIVKYSKTDNWKYLNSTICFNETFQILSNTNLTKIKSWERKIKCAFLTNTLKQAQFRKRTNWIWLKANVYKDSQFAVLTLFFLRIKLQRESILNLTTICFYDFHEIVRLIVYTNKYVGTLD